MDTRKEYTKPAIESGVLEQTSLTCNVTQEWSYVEWPFFIGARSTPSPCPYRNDPGSYSKHGAWEVETCEWIIWGGSGTIVPFS